MKNKFIKKKIKGIEVDVRTKDCMYITIGKWVIYIVSLFPLSFVEWLRLISSAWILNPVTNANEYFFLTTNNHLV